MLCGRSWEKLEALYDALISVADPSMVSSSSLCFENSQLEVNTLFRYAKHF